MQIRYGAILPVSAEEAFDFVSSPASWPSFFRQMDSADAREGWGEVGGRASMVNRILGQEIVTDLVLVEWDRPRSFRYVGHNRGRPDTENHRVFDPVPGGTRLTGTTTVEATPGLRGLVDRITVLAVRRTFRRAMKRLPTQVAGP
jgi:hypothetical protein